MASEATQLTALLSLDGNNMRSVATLHHLGAIRRFHAVCGFNIHRFSPTSRSHPRIAKVNNAAFIDPFHDVASHGWGHCYRLYTHQKSK